jgi:hypothetical protein
MRKLAILILMVSTSVFADWNEVTRSSDGDQTVYVDSDSIKKKGNKFTMWSLLDFKTVQKFENDRFLSQMMREEYDCQEETQRLLDLYLYSGNMRGGGIVYSETNIKMEAASTLPGSIGETSLNRVCGKK